MKKIFSVLLPLIIICGLDFDIVLAEETPEPTPTYIPAFKPTVVYDHPGDEVVDLSCPADGIIDGLGSCTPSALWYQRCSHCIEENMIMTPVPPAGGEGTPYDENTTLYTNMSQIFQVNGEGDYVINFVPDVYYNGDDNTRGVFYGNYTGGIDYYINTINFQYGLEQTAGLPPNYCDITNHLRATIQNNMAHEMEVTIYKNGSVYYESGTVEYGDYIYPILRSWSACTVQDWVDEFEIEFYIDTWFDHVPQIELSFNILNELSNQDYLFDVGFTWIQGPWVCPGGDYCGSVICEGDSPYDSIFPEPGFGDIYCFDIGPYEYHPLGIDIVVPHVAHVCFQELTLGVASILGVSYSMDFMLLVICFGWLLIMLMTA